MTVAQLRARREERHALQERKRRMDRYCMVLAGITGLFLGAALWDQPGDMVLFASLAVAWGVFGR